MSSAFSFCPPAIHRILFAQLLVVGALTTAGANPIVEGNARFTVITPECIRIEYSQNAKFIDERSLFAVDRKASSDAFKLERNGGVVSIDTGRIRLEYTPDGKPPGPENLKATIRNGDGEATWSPGTKNPGNLGGTLRTLDMVKGAVDLGAGLLSRDGWYLLDDSKSALLVGDWVEARPEDAGTDWYLFGYGEDFKAGLKSLVTIGGPAPMPRRYALGAWYSRYWAFTSDDYKAIVDEYREHDFPLDVIVMDMDWHRDGWTGWSWNKKLIPDPRGLLAWFHKQGLHVTLNLHPADGVAPHEDQYSAFMKALKQDPAKKETLPFDAGSERYMQALLEEVLAPLQRDGVDFWWLDWQQYPFTRSIPTLTNLAWLNVVLFRSTEFDGQRGISLSRWGGWGDHRHPIQFSGDADTGWPMLEFEVPFTSTAGNVGCYYWSHDIGGHVGGRNEESYARWVQFGATTAALRSHSARRADMDRRPWNYPKWAEDSMRIAFHLRSELMPYIYSSAWQTYRTGVSLNRPLYLEYPKLAEAYRNGQEYLLGDNLLVAPIVMPGVGPGRVGWQAVWFPPGDEWYHVFTGEKFDGDQTRIVAADINEFPLFARGGVPIPLQPYRDRPATAALTTLRVRCYPGADGREGVSTLYEDDGISEKYLDGQSALTRMSYSRKGDRVSVVIEPASGKYQGQPASRTCEIELANTRPATEVTVNGVPAKSEYLPELGINRISVPFAAIGKPLHVEATVPDAPAAEFARAAAARRMNGIVSANKTSRDDLSSTENAALLAVNGVAVMPYHESPTLFGDPVKYALFAPAGVIEGGTVTRIAETNSSGDLSETRSELKVGQTGSAGSIVLEPGYQQLQFRINGRNCSLETPELRKTGNLAPLAKAEASSSENGHSAADAIDGEADGYPEHPSSEWASNREKTGARLTLRWDTPQKVRRILLYDRPNLSDQVMHFRITFSDGSSLEGGPIPDDGKTPLILEFPEKTITSLAFEVTGVKEATQNSGLAEIGVY